MDKKEYLALIDEVIARGRYRDSWDSLAEHEVPEWFKRAKVGVFLHWGVYSVPAYFTEWYPRLMYYRQNPVYWHHNRKYGRHFDYHEFIPMFKAEKFDADAWLDEIQKLGADFIMPVAEHHDGFKMYGSELNRWNAVEMGPRRDVLGELKDACAKRGVRFAVSNHRAEHYWFMNGAVKLGYKTAACDEEYRDFYGPCVNDDQKNTLASLLRFHGTIEPDREWLEDWLVSACEVVDKYCPSCYYFDSYSASPKFRPYMAKFLAYYYNRAEERGEEAVSYYKIDAALYPCGVYVKERGLRDGMGFMPWQCETATAKNAWCYCTTNRYKTAADIICNMIDVWSKNGCININFGPKADGTFCDEERRLFDEIGEWMKIHGEAIRGAIPYKEYGEGKRRKTGSFKENYRYTKKDIRFTYKLGCLYAFVLAPNGASEFRIKSFAKEHKGICNAVIKSASVLGSDVKVSVERKSGYAKLTLSSPVRGRLPICFKLEVE